MAQEKEYFAFISYQRKDEEWADRLRSKLEHYRLPSSVRKQNASLPKEIRPIFRDALELAGGVLAKEIETALQHSKFLIVICSPNSAKSPWVNKEIQTFIDFDREDCIIPFIIDGTPFSNNEETECFPLAIRSLKGGKELLGININELSRDAASIKVVARMFGLKFDTLWQRHERELRRKRWTWIGGAILFALLGLGIGGYFVRQNTIIESQNERLQQDSVTMAEHLIRIQNDSIKLSIQNDSISLQNALILNQRDSLKKTTKELQLSNLMLVEERDNVIKANWKFMENRAKYMAERIRELTEEGDLYTALQLSIEVLPKNLDNPEIPYEPMVENAFRVAVEKWEEQSYCPITIFDGHSASVKTVALSPNGKYAATGSDDCTIMIWEATTGIPVKTLLGHAAPVSSIDFDSTGRLLASASADFSVRVWDINRGNEVAQLEYKDKFNSKVETIRFGPTDSTVVFSLHNKAINWNYITNKIEDIYECELTSSSTVHAANYSKDGKSFLIAGDDDKIHVYSTETRKEIRCIDGDSCQPKFWWIRGTEFSPDGTKVVSGSYDNSVRVWEISTGKEIFMKWHTKTADNLGFVNAVQFSNNGKFFVSGGFDGVINIWDSEKGNRLNTLNGKEKNIWDLRISNDDSYLISTYWKNKAILYRLDDKKEKTDNIVMSHNDFPYLKLKWPDVDVNFIEDGCYSHSGHYIATAARDDRIRIWDSKTGILLHTFSFESWLRKNKMGNRIAYPESISFSPDDKYLVIGNYDGQIFIMNSETGNIENVFFNNLKDSEKLPSFGHTAADVQSKGISCVRYTPNGDMVVFTSHDFYTHIINPKSADCTLTLKGHLAPVYNLSFDRECKYIVTCSRDKTIKMWNDKGVLVKTLTGHSNEVYAAVCSPKEDIIISISGDRTMRIWNYKGQEIHEPISFEKTPQTICFSPNGEYIACSDETVIYVFETKTFQEIHRYMGHTYTITSVSFCPSGNQIMSTANDGTCRIWKFNPLSILREDIINKYSIIPLTTNKKQQLLYE